MIGIVGEAQHDMVERAGFEAMAKQPGLDLIARQIKLVRVDDQQPADDISLDGDVDFKAVAVVRALCSRPRERARPLTPVGECRQSGDSSFPGAAVVTETFKVHVFRSYVSLDRKFRRSKSVSYTKGRQATDAPRK